MTSADYQRNYIRRLETKLRDARGNKCEGDGCHETAALEWAHVKPTKLHGWSRGEKHRLLDVQRNPDCYLLLCVPCHSDHDGVHYNRGLRADDGTQESIPF